MTKPKNFEEYLLGFPEIIQKRLEKLHAIICREAPEAEEIISYGMPAFRLHGMLLYFAAHTNHIGFYPFRTAIQAYQNELAVYKTATGSVQFPHNKPIPVNLIARMVRFRVNENLEKQKAKKKIKKIENKR